MELSQARKKQLRAIGHGLRPVVTLSERGYGEGVARELERALDDHELIKIKLAINDGEARRELIGELCQAHQATLVQAIGKTALILRPSRQPNPRLSNLLRQDSRSS